jgi:hypothetical protein
LGTTSIIFIYYIIKKNQIIEKEKRVGKKRERETMVGWRSSED